MLTNQRLTLNNGEQLFVLEGGCFENKMYDNEVVIRNSVKDIVGSVVFVGQDAILGNQVLLNIVKRVDVSLLILFAYFAMVTQ